MKQSVKNKLSVCTIGLSLAATSACSESATFHKSPQSPSEVAAFDVVADPIRCPLDTVCIVMDDDRLKNITSPTQVLAEYANPNSPKYFGILEGMIGNCQIELQPEDAALNRILTPSEQRQYTIGNEIAMAGFALELYDCDDVITQIGD